jgi:hypothetical protein
VENHRLQMSHSSMRATEFAARAHSSFAKGLVSATTPVLYGPAVTPRRSVSGTRPRSAHGDSSPLDVRANGFLEVPPLRCADVWSRPAVQARAREKAQRSRDRDPKRGGSSVSGVSRQALGIALAARTGRRNPSARRNDGTSSTVGRAREFFNRWHSDTEKAVVVDYSYRSASTGSSAAAFVAG